MEKMHEWFLHALRCALREEQADMELSPEEWSALVALAQTHKVLPMLLEENSVLILSGILDTRLNDVLQALNKVGLEPVRIREKEDWRCVCAKRRTV